MPGMAKEDEFPLDMTVEIYGIIHIYNPPDPEKLGVEQVTEDTVIDGSGETLGGQKVDKADAAPVEGELPTPAPTPAAPAGEAAPPVTRSRVTAPPVAMLPPT